MIINIQQQQEAMAAAVVYNQAPTLIAGYPTPLAAYLAAHQQQQSANASYQQHHSQLQSMAASNFPSSAATQIHLLQQQQQQAQNIANLATNNNAPGSGNAAVLLPSIAMPITTANPMDASTTCPYHPTPPIDTNINGGARQRLRMNDTNNNTNTFIDEMLIQQRQAQLLV